jgi:hypothetical protein
MQRTLLAAALLATASLTTPAGAQERESFGARVRRVAREAQEQARAERCASDPSRCAASADAPTAQATATAAGGRVGDRVTVVEGRIQGSDSLRSLWDTAGKVGVRRTARPCTLPNRPACVAGWDLRFVAVQVPRDTIPASQPIPVTYVIENRGRLASPATEVQVCTTGEYGDPSCAASIEEFELPAVAPGETVTLTRVWRTPVLEERGGMRVYAVIDRDRASGATNRANDAAVTRVLQLNGPALQFVAYAAPERVVRGRPFEVTFTLRNRSFAASSPPTEIQFDNPGIWGGPQWRMVLPSLGPRQTYTVRARIQSPEETRFGGLRTLIAPDAPVRVVGGPRGVQDGRVHLRGPVTPGTPG